MVSIARPNKYVVWQLDVSAYQTKDWIVRYMQAEKWIRYANPTENITMAHLFMYKYIIFDVKLETWNNLQNKDLLLFFLQDKAQMYSLLCTTTDE